MPGKRLAGILVRASAERRRGVYESVVRLSAPTRPFFLLVALSTVIASFGLLANSTAVIIGAMLVAPLMGPIFGVALGLARGDPRLFRTAAAAELAGGILVIAISALVGLIPLHQAFGSEIVSRTQPTLYDLIVALASGLAGAYAVVDERVSPALPGVAIATALAPPLATCGLCLAAAQFESAAGAFLLFFGNFLAIELAAAAVFLVLGIVRTNRVGGSGWAPFLRRFGPSLLALLLVGAFMTRTLVNVVAEARTKSRTQSTLGEQFKTMIGVHLTDLRFERSAGVLHVTAAVLTPTALEPDQVAALEERLRVRVDPGTKLVVRSILSKDADDAGPVFVTKAEEAEDPKAAAMAEFLRVAHGVLEGALKEVAGARLTELSREGEVLRAVVRTPSAVDPAKVARMQQALRQALSPSVGLVVRSIIAVDADAEKFLYGTEKEEAATDPERSSPTGHRPRKRR